ncbi:MAG: ribose 5-phosphate isomerase B [Bdellovibrionota bacterium]
MNDSTFNIYIASDHAGVDFKKGLQKHLPEMRWVDLGPSSTSSVDYPDYAQKLCHQLLEEPHSLGVLICGTGIGMSIAANRIKGIRAALVTGTTMATMAKAHNNANVLCLGARIIGPDLAAECVQAWLQTAFEGDRHQRRLDKIETL